jgi:hypothetical protein
MNSRIRGGLDSKQARLIIAVWCRYTISKNIIAAATQSLVKMVVPTSS